MKIRADIAELIRAGHTDASIARRLHCGTTTVGNTRRAIGYPPATTLSRLYAEAIDDMAAHGLLADHIKFTTGMALRSSLAIHYPDVCRPCLAREGAANGQQGELPMGDG